MNWRTVFQVAATYVGAVMGAGFASGQEIQQFFARFGSIGLAGVGLTAVFFGLLGWLIIDLIQRQNITSYSELFTYLFGLTWGKRVDLLMTALLAVSMVAMLSGSGALFNQYFGMSGWIGIGFTALLVLVALMFRGEGVLWINSALIPLKFIFCFGVAVLALLLAESGVEVPAPPANVLLNHWGLAAVLYVSFNLTFAMAVFASLGNELRLPEARLGGIAGGMVLGLFAAIIALALLKFPGSAQFEIPMVAVAGKLGPWPAFCYMLVLWMAMITAAIGSGFSLVKRFTALKKVDYNRFTILLILMAVPVAGVRFSDIVEFVYPLIGYIGFIVVPLLLYGWLKSARRPLRRR